MKVIFEASITTKEDLYMEGIMQNMQLALQGLVKCMIQESLKEKLTPEIQDILSNIYVNSDKFQNQAETCIDNITETILENIEIELNKKEEGE